MDSLGAQTSRAWRAVVVDDGSDDATAQVVERYASADGRYSLVRQAARGVGAARNAGMAAATTSLVSFLDADDLLDARFVEEMLRPFDEGSVPAPDATYTGWLRLAPDGSTEHGPIPELDGDLFHLFGAVCAFPPHACVIHRRVLERAGGFDERPTTTEDWDLWQRVARTGARFVRVPGALAIYRMRQGSRSRDHRRVLDDGLRVISQGHAADNRVRHPHPDHTNGLEKSLLGRHAFAHLCWAAGMALASGADPIPLLDSLAHLAAPDLDPWVVAGTVLESVRVALCAPRRAGRDIVAPLAEPLRAFLDALETATHARGIALRSIRALDHLLVQQCDPARPRAMLASYDDTLDLTRPVTAMRRFPPGLDRYRADLTYGGEWLGDIELPICDGLLLGRVVRDAVAREFHWELLSRFLSRTVYRSLEVDRLPSGVQIRRGAVVLATDQPADAADDREMLHETVGWAVFLQELLGVPDASLDDIYGNRLMSEEPAVAAQTAVATVDLSDPRRDLRTSATMLEVRASVGGVPFSRIRIPTAGGAVRAGDLARTLVESLPREMLHLAVREGIIGWRIDDGVPFRERLRRRRRGARPAMRASLPLGGLALMRHAGAPPSGFASLLATLPAGAREAIERLALATGTPVKEVSTPAPAADAVAHAAYVPDGAWERLPHDEERRAAAGPGASDERATSRSLPILRYRRVTPDPGRSAAAYSLHPERFEEQVAYLQKLGYRSTTPGDWQSWLDRSGEGPARRVLFTFDGGYEDFARHAWPILARHGFGALLFVVTDDVGGVAARDAKGGTAFPLLDWAGLDALYREGVELGSLSASHPWLTGCSPDEVVREMMLSRAAIRDRIGTDAKYFAYPYGDEDRAIHHLAAASGYHLAFTQRPGRWGRHENRLALPRLAIPGTVARDDFVALFTEV